jgi:predicted metal-dependent hydrolase
VSAKGRPERELLPRGGKTRSVEGAPRTGDARSAARADAGTLRRISLAGHDVDYRLIRARRRSIGMEIGLSGLTVRASRWVTIREIEAVLTERAAWIVRTIAAWHARRRDVLPRAWKSGAPILFRGAELSLVVEPARRTAIAADMFHLTVRLPAADDETSVAALVGSWLRDEALRALTPRVGEYGVRLIGRVPPTRLSNARSEWGSCDHNGEIRLNWRLVQLPPHLADYVVAHEVAHLVELNHSPRFWAIVESLFPGHRAARRDLGEWTALLEA